jgi:hypothetical protein
MGIIGVEGKPDSPCDRWPLGRGNVVRTSDRQSGQIGKPTITVGIYASDSGMQPPQKRHWYFREVFGVVRLGLSGRLSEIRCPEGAGSDNRTIRQSDKIGQNRTNLGKNVDKQGIKRCPILSGQGSRNGVKKKSGRTKSDKLRKKGAKCRWIGDIFGHHREDSYAHNGSVIKQVKMTHSCGSKGWFLNGRLYRHDPRR